MKKISCIIPAYNEEEGIINILPVVIPLLDKYLYEIIVVDDGSKDKTKQIVEGFPQVKLIVQETNRGKSRTVADGIRASKGDYIFLLDADLKFLNENNIIDLLAPIENNTADVSISYRKNSWPLFPFKKIDYLSGERILPKSYLIEKIDQMSLLPSYALEVFINKIIINNKLAISVVQWPNVENNFSQNKRGWFKGISTIIKVWWNILCTISIFEMYYQNIKMAQLITYTSDNSHKNFKISLIIPAHNEEKYIGSCLDHVVMNSNGRFHEIIVVNNASTDKTSEVVSKYPEVKMIYENNKGLTFARQRGFIESTGEILAYIDADTRMPKGYIEKIIKEFNNNNMLACYSGPHEYYDINLFYRILNKAFWVTIAMPTYKIVGYMTAGVNFAIRREALNKMGGFDTSINFYGEDTDIARRANEHGKVKFSMSFGMPTSGRRISDHGIIKSFFVYTSNFASEIFLHKPITKEYKDIR
jgi:glycosyltransferase involved in cell wall biosynthesis